MEDIISLEDELNLNSTALEAAYLIAAKHKRDWLQVLLSQGDTIKDFASSIGRTSGINCSILSQIKAH